MTNQAQPGRPPAHDLSAFDLSKRSPEQVARSFAHWKAQRKRQAEAGPARADPLPSPQPAVAETGNAAPAETAAAPKRASTSRASAPQYSAPFSDLLAAGSEPTIQRTDRPPVAALRPPQPTASPGRRLRVMSILAGAASVFALAGGALLELGDWRDPAEVAPRVMQVRPKDTPMALAAAATSVRAIDWTLQRTVDLALMKSAPDAVRPTPEPPTPAIQTASKAVPVTSDKPVLPERKSSAPVQFVAKPYVPNVAPAPARIPAVQAAAPIPAVPVASAIHAGDPRPDDLFQHGRDNRNGAVSNRTVNNRSASGGKPAAATGTGSAVDARSASARNSAAATGASVDPRGEGSGGARVGIDGKAGTPSDASGGGSGGESGTGDAGDVSGDGGANDGSSAGAADGGDAAGDGAGDAGTGDGGTGDTGAGGGDTGGAGSGDASDGGSSAGDSDAGEDGESGAIGGAVGGALDAVDDALGGGKGNPDSNDKDQRN